MKTDAEFDIIVYGATGYTGRLVAEHLVGRGADIRWAMAGRSAAKLAEVRDEIGAAVATPLIVADAADPAQVRAMVRRAKAVITTVGPYQLYGSDLVAACAEVGTDYLDLSGEPTWMRQMIDAHEAAAKASGARILFSCGFDSIPFELGVWFAQDAARKAWGAPAPYVKGRVRAIRGGLSGGTAASGKATMEAMGKDPTLFPLMMDPFALTPGFQGPEQPRGDKPGQDEDAGGPVGPFMMAIINTKNVHRSNALMGHAYGRDFAYDEMVMGGPEDAPAFTDLGGSGGPQPGEGPTKEEREAGFYDLLFIGVHPDGRRLPASVKGDRDPGYGSTSKMIAETAICLIGAPDVAGGIWTPGAALQGRLVDQLTRHAGLTFAVEG